VAKTKNTRINESKRAVIASVMKNGAAKIESSKKGRMYFIVLEGKEFF
jgi:hypothetical protein